MPRPEATQAPVIAFLKARGTLAPDQTPEVVETHCALIFLTDDMAFKIKRAVAYDYLDYSTPEKRRHMLERELELNRPAAPGIYRDVIPITKTPSGALALGGEGAPVDWVLRMTRFAASDELSVIAARGRLDDALASQTGRQIAAYHAAAPQRDASGAELVAEILDELETVFATMTDALGADRTATWSSASRAGLRAVTPLLIARGKAGFVRRCHGDLHLRNIVLIDGVPTPFDALEFDERLGTCDVLYDLAFLLMDLMHGGLRRGANLVLNGYAEAARDFDAAGLGALPLFLGVRAAIRAMVDIQTDAATHDTDLVADARDYLDQGIAWLKPPPARLVAIGGVSGTGKTTVARAIAPRLGAAPGALHLRSDVARKQLFGVDPLQKLPQPAYAPDVTARVYERLHADARAVLAAGHSVLLDATHMDQNERDAAAALARDAGCAFHGIWLTGAPETLIARVGSRHGDASDADAKVVRAMLARDPGPLDWARVDCSGPPGEVAGRVAARLGLT